MSLLLSHREALLHKLQQALTVEHLKELARQHRVAISGTKDKMARALAEALRPEDVDRFLREEYRKRVFSPERVEALVRELGRITQINWPVIQGGLDRRIRQALEGVFDYDTVLNRTRAQLHQDITDYAVAVWYNTRTTDLIEQTLFLRPELVPVLARRRGLDCYFRDQPFDLKVTYLPEGWSLEMAMNDPLTLARWFYENQSEERFGAHNRLFLVLHKADEPEASWKLKREVDWLRRKVGQLLPQEIVSYFDVVSFRFKRQEHKAVSKVLFLVWP